jgi:triacylglycerol esterase/lipase EstA (alpha/beta hydrolase family)
MISRFVRAALFAELLLYFAIGAWLVHAQMWSVPYAIAAALAAALGARLGFTVASYALGGTAAPPATMLREFRAVLGSNFLGVPFPDWVTPPDSRAAPSPRPPVILVHGYFGNRGFWGPLMRWLEREGVSPVFAPNFPATFTTIEVFAEALHAEVERIAAATGQSVVLVCHSMGGLATRCYLAHHGASRVARVVTIASPHGGTVLSRFGLGANAAQMCRDSAFIGELRRAEAGRAAVPFTSIYSRHDNMVAPCETCRLEWARHIVLEGLGHIAILQSPATFAVLRDELRECGVVTGG